MYAAAFHFCMIRAYPTFISIPDPAASLRTNCWRCSDLCALRALTPHLISRRAPDKSVKHFSFGGRRYVVTGGGAAPGVDKVVGTLIWPVVIVLRKKDSNQSRFVFYCIWLPRYDDFAHLITLCFRKWTTSKKSSYIFSKIGFLLRTKYWSEIFIHFWMTNNAS